MNMRKRIMGIVLSAILLAGSMNSIAQASPQKPFHWMGWIGNYTFDWNEDTAVEMRNGDGSDVLSVNGQYIIDHMLPYSTWPMLMSDGSIPDDVKTVSCQVVKEDAYFIMPFDGYVTIGIEDEQLSGDHGDICVRAKAGDKINMVPKNLVVTYYDEASVRSRYANNTVLSAQEIEKNIQETQYYAGTTADDWTYNLRIYKEIFIPLHEIKNNRTVKHEVPELISVPLYNNNDFACLWFIYQVDAPNTEIKAVALDQEAQEKFKMYFGEGKYMLHPNTELNGWYEDPMHMGQWVYLEEGKRKIHAIGNGYISLDADYDQNYGMYSDGKMTIEDNVVVVDGKEINNIWNGTHMIDDYNIVNVQ